MRKTSNKVAGRVTVVPENSVHYQEGCSQCTLLDRWCNNELCFFVKCNWKSLKSTDGVLIVLHKTL